MKVKWKDDEVEFLKKNYSTRTPLEEISEKLGRTTKSIQRKAQDLEISRPRKKFDISKLRMRQKRANDKFYLRNSKEIYQRKKSRRHKIKEELVLLMGGKCEICGYDKCIFALEFHHKGEKEKDIANIIKNESKEKALKEIKKCILLCANCHRELHNKGA